MSGSGSDLEKIMDPDLNRVFPERMDPDPGPVCPERMDPDPVCPDRMNPDYCKIPTTT